MSTSLNAMLPLSDPYGLGETVTAIPANAVDWVKVELRDVAGTTVVESRAAFVLDNGSVVDTDGTSPVTFTTMIGASYHVAIQHRNHLGVMTANPISF